MNLSRRQFLKLTAAGIGATSLGALGFAPDRVLADVRKFKLAHDHRRRGTPARTARSAAASSCTASATARRTRARELIHIEGDPDHPVNRGTLCPKGASLLDFVNSPNRLKFPEHRAPGSSEWKRVTWDWALDRIARLMKDDRDANFLERNAAGLTVNRWTTFGMLAASASSNESGYLTHKAFRAMGMVAIDNQARV